MKDKNFFKRIFDSLDEAQKEAVESKDNYIFVSGAPGTGKTKVVLCHSALLMLECGFKSDEIILFSRLSNMEFEKRIYELIRKNYSEFFPHSFIPFCMKILKKNWYKIDGINPNFELLSDFKRNIIIGEIIKDAGSTDYRTNIKNVNSETAEFIRMLKQNNILFDNFEKIFEKGNFDREYIFIKKIYEAYSDILISRDYLDYDDIILKTIEFFENARESERYIKKFKKLIVDDFMEINPLQYRLLKVLSGVTENIFVTGNSEQDVFGFSGEFTKNLLNIFNEDFPGTKIIRLEKNYRSDRKLLIPARKFYNSELKGFTKAKYNIPQSSLTVAVEKSILDEAFYVGKKINSIINSEIKNVAAGSDIKEGFTYSDFAVLLRDVNEYGFIYKHVFDYLEIPNSIDGSLNIACFKELNYLLLYLRFLANPDDNEVFKTLLSNSFTGFSPVELSYLLKLSERESKELDELMRHIDSGNITLEGDYSELIHKIEMFNKRFDELLKSLQKLSFPDFMLNFVYSIFFADLPEGIDKEILRKFIDISIDYYEICSVLKWECSLKDFLKFFNEYKENLFDNLTDDEEESNTVKITSMYKSKGKEFQVVFIPLLTETNFPTGFTEERFFTKDLERIKEGCKKVENIEFYSIVIRDFNDHITREKNLFLTALTAAREKLFLSFPRNLPGIEEVRPSIFLRDIFGGKPVNRENAKEISANFEENGYSDFIDKVIKIDEPELYKQITSQDELEIVLKRLCLEKDKLLNLLGKYNYDFLDNDYLFSESSCLQENPSIRKIDDSFTFSSSSINTYRDCPRKFYYSRILKLKFPKSIHITIGIIEHEILQNIHNRLKVNQFDENVLESIFDEVWKKYKNNFESDFFEWIWKDYVSVIIKQYMNKYGIHSANVHLTEKDFEFCLDEKYLISGKIDRIDKIDNGYEIIDYKKSGNGLVNSWINKFYKKSEDFQMPIYFLAAKKYFKLEPKILSYFLLDFKKNRECEKIEIKIKEEPDTKKRVTHITEEIIEEVKEKLISILAQISKERESFDRAQDTICGNPHSDYLCEYINICNQSK